MPNERRNGTWPLVRDIGFFLVGAFILVEQTLQEVIFGVPNSPVLVGAGLACWGVTGSGAIGRAIKKKLDEE